MANDGIGREAPSARSIDIDELVDAVDPDPGYIVVYPARRPGEGEFLEFDPYDWVDQE